MSERPAALEDKLVEPGDVVPDPGGGPMPHSEWLRRSTLAAAVTSGALIAQQVAGKAVRDSLFLTNFEPASLPRVMAVAAVASLLAVVVLSRALTRYAPRGVMPMLFGLSAVGLALEWALGQVFPDAGAVAVYLHVTVFSPIVMTCFWSLINETFDPHTARSTMARIAAGGTWGGVVGGLGAWRASSVLTPANAVLLLAALNALCILGTLGIRSPERRAPEADAHDISALSVLRKAPFLRNLALLVLVGSAVSTLLDYVFSAQATLQVGQGQALLSFFGFFGLCVSVTSLLLQLTLGRVAMEKVGLAVNIGVLPGIVVLGSMFGMSMPNLLSVGLLRGAEMVQRNTLFRSAYELLYTPLPDARKRATKALIDVGVDRLGTVLGSAVMMVILLLSVDEIQQQRYVLAVAVVLALLTFPIVRALHHGYVGALEQGLREGAAANSARPSLAGAGEPQSAFVHDVKERTRDRLIERIERLREHDDDRGPAHDAMFQSRALLSATTDLLSGDVPRARHALENWNDAHRPLGGFAIVLLSHPSLHTEARAALKRIATLATGQLIDALVDPKMEFAVRRRIPPILALSGTARAAHGLLLALDDERFEVRYSGGRGLLQLATAHPEVVIAEDVIFEKIRAEAARAPTPAENDFGDDAADTDATQALLEIVEIDRVSRTVELLFMLLAVVTDREPLRHCFRALQAKDSRQRGTALEYLHATLPTDVREAVWPLVGEAGPLPAPRAAAEALKELIEAEADHAAATPSPSSSAASTEPDVAGPQKTPPNPRPPPPG